MRVPQFTAAQALYHSRRRYRRARSPEARGAVVVPAIPACRNCDYILDRCAENNWRPAALCWACAVGNCYEEPPPPPPFSDEWDGFPRW